MSSVKNYYIACCKDFMEILLNCCQNFHSIKLTLASECFCSSGIDFDEDYVSFCVNMIFHDKNMNNFCFYRERVLLDHFSSELHKITDMSSIF